MFEGQKVLITGGTGSWGQQLTRELLKHHPREIRIFSRNEFAQVNMQRTFCDFPNLTFLIGDVRDYNSVRDASRGVDVVFHLAALKHVPICEFQPEEALKTNIKGTENVILASIENNVKKVIDVSTDKAVDPINFYGMTKAFGEKLIIRANNLSNTTRFVCIRAGNVLGSNGSVVPFFKKRILDNRVIPITSKEMTRFFLTIPEAITLLLQAATIAVGGETLVMRMNACRITDLAQVLVKNLTGNELQIEEIGIRPGEKLNEVLISHYESPYTRKYKDRYFVILPSHPSPNLRSHYAHFPKVDFQKYESSDNLMSFGEIEHMLKRGGFLN